MKTKIYNKIIAISLELFCLLSAIGCSDYQISLPEQPEPEVGEKSNETIYIWTDDYTGVQYVIYREKSGYAGFGGITPRLNPDGSLCVVETTTEAE